MRRLVIALVLLVVACKGPGPCNDTADCEPRSGWPVCDTADGVCVECVSDADCERSDDGPRCRANHTCGCTRDSDCAFVCGAITSTCVECRGDGDCAIGSCDLFGSCD